ENLYRLVRPRPLRVLDKVLPPASIRRVPQPVRVRAEEVAAVHVEPQKQNPRRAVAPCALQRQHAGVRATEDRCALHLLGPRQAIRAVPLAREPLGIRVLLPPRPIRRGEEVSPRRDLVGVADCSDVLAAHAARQRLGHARSGGKQDPLHAQPSLTPSVTGSVRYSSPDSLSASTPAML